MWILLQAQSLPPELPGGYGASLLQGLLSLGAVCLLAWIVLRFASKQGLGVGQRSARMKVIERVAIDARRSLFIVEVAGKTLLIGAGDGGPPTLITELDSDAVAAFEPTPKRSFADILTGLRTKPRPNLPSEDESDDNSSDDSRLSS